MRGNRLPSVCEPGADVQGQMFKLDELLELENNNNNKPYLAENIFLQSTNCNILRLAITVAFFANETQFTPHFVYISDITQTHHLSMVNFKKKK